MTILVTGGAGFIGANFILYEKKQYPNDRIVCLDKLTYAANLKNLSSVFSDSHFRFIEGDICDQALVLSVMEEERPDVIVNFAAESHVDKSIEDPCLFFHSNLLGVNVLLDAVRKYPCRFHQISTDEVYGDTPLTSQLKFRETDALRPSSPYAASKAAADLLICSYIRTFKIQASISRSTNNFGPFQHAEKLIPTIISNTLNSTQVPVYGNGENVRDWIYVLDHCKAVDKIVRSPKTIGQIYNVSADEPIKNIDLIKRIQELLGLNDPLFRFVPDRKGHDLRYAVDSEKIRATLGWQAETDFDEGLQKTVEWFLKEYEKQ